MDTKFNGVTVETNGVRSIAGGGTGATNAEAARTNLGLGTAATTDASAYATAAQGTKADSALQSGAAISNISGLQTALDGKAATSHTHTLSQLTQSGATNTQVPTWNGTAWVPQTPSGGVTNNLYANNYWISPLIGTFGAGAAMVANNIYLYPFTVERSITVGELGARVTTGVAASSVQLAIYASSDGQPNGAPLATTVSLSGVTATIITDNVTDFNLSEKTTYWMAVNSNAAITMQHLTGLGTLTAAYVIGAPTLANISNAATTSGGWRSVAQTFGTWPTLSAGATTVQTSSPRGGIVFLQISALL